MQQIVKIEKGLIALFQIQDRYLFFGWIDANMFSVNSLKSRPCFLESLAAFKKYDGITIIL